MMHNVNIEEMKKMKFSVLALSLFSIVEIEPIEHLETVMHDVNIEDMMKVKPSILALSLFSSTRPAATFNLKE